jgi:pyrroline-5-carboxylate reductase
VVNKHQSIGIVGCGNMGGALASGLVASGFDSVRLWNRNHEKAEVLAKHLKIKCVDSLSELLRTCQVIILAAKPVGVIEIIKEIQVDHLLDGKLFVSIAAGVSSSQLRENLGEKVKLVRVMPNIGCVQKVGVCGVYAEDQDSFLLTQELFSTLGKVIRVEKEELIDVATALSGSGPAFLLKALSGMIEAGETLGLSKSQALEFGLGALGSANATLAKGNKSITEIISMIASPKGTTEAGLKVLTDNDVEVLFADAVSAGAKRAEEIRKELDNK